VRSFALPAFHERGVRICVGGQKVRLALVEDALLFASLASVTGDPVVCGGVLCQERLVVGRGQFVELGRRRLALLGGRAHVILLLLCARMLFLSKELVQVLFHVEARSDGIQGGIGIDLGGIEVQLLAPDQPGFDAQLYDPLEELAEHREAETLADAGETGVIGQSLEEIVAHVPPCGEALGDEAHQFSLAADILMEHDQLQAKEDFGVDARTAGMGVEIRH
jgi:hypothetical protein